MTLPLAALYVGLAVLANWLAARYVAPVGFGYVAPAGVYAIGAVLVLRDWLQQLAGLRVALALVYVAGGVSWAAGTLAGWTGLQRVALASVVAFTLSETVEALVFTPLRRRSLTAGVAASATVGNVLDSVVFLSIAFGSLHFLVGQLLGKTWAIAAGTLLTALRRRALPAPATA